MRNQRLLLVEGDISNGTMTSELLASEGYDAIWVRTAQEAMGAAVKHRPDLILVDFDATDTDGSSIAKQLTQLPETKRIPVVAITGEPTEATFEAAIRGGCVGCMQKRVASPCLPWTMTSPSVFMRTLRRFMDTARVPQAEWTCSPRSVGVPMRVLAFAG